VPIDRRARQTALVDLIDDREAKVGQLTVRRALPTRGHRTVGAWCFLDHLGPITVTEDDVIDIGPHPHMGLQTVTWLFAGELLHRDSLGSEQLIRAGQLNLMTAGHGIAHSEEHTGRYRGAHHGMQLWVAQPAATRDGAPAFEHHADLPQLDIIGGTATVLVGEQSPARRDTDHFGMELALHGDAVLELDPRHEHALAVAEGAVRVDDQVVEPGALAYFAPGADERRFEVRGPTRALLLGGTPFPETVLMWWNFVARTQVEVTEAFRDWADDGDRFGTVASPLARIDVGPPPWQH